MSSHTFCVIFWSNPPALLSVRAVMLIEVSGFLSSSVNIVLYTIISSARLCNFWVFPSLKLIRSNNLRFHEYEPSIPMLDAALDPPYHISEAPVIHQSRCFAQQKNFFVVIVSHHRTAHTQASDRAFMIFSISTHHCLPHKPAYTRLDLVASSAFLLIICSRLLVAIPGT